MAITKASILTAVNSRTGRVETDIDTILSSILTDICLTGPFLKTSTTLTFSASDAVESFPSDCLAVLAVGGLTYKSFESLLKFQQALTSEGTPEYWTAHNKSVHLWPTPNAETALTVYYVQLDDDVDTIALSDEFWECIAEGCCFKLYESYGMAEEAAVHKGLYDEQLAKLLPLYQG